MHEKTKEELINYMLRQVQSVAERLTAASVKNLLSREEKKPWLVIFHADNDEVDDFWIKQKKLSAILVCFIRGFV